MIGATLLAILLTQSAASRDEVAGASITLNQAAENFASVVVTLPDPNRACLSRPSNTIPPGSVTLRVGVVILSQAGQRAIFGDGDGDTYAAFEVQAPPSIEAIMRPPPPIDWLEDSEIEKRVSPVFPTDGAGRNCQISIVRSGFASMPWRCACAANAATCTWTGGATVRDLTFAPGTWSGAGCVRKPCVERMGTESMPGVCK